MARVWVVLAVLVALAAVAAAKPDKTPKDPKPPSPTDAPSPTKTPSPDSPTDAPSPTDADSPDSPTEAAAPAAAAGDEDKSEKSVSEKSESEDSPTKSPSADSADDGEAAPAAGADSGKSEKSPKDHKLYICHWDGDGYSKKSVAKKAVVDEDKVKGHFKNHPDGCAGDLGEENEALCALSSHHFDEDCNCAEGWTGDNCDEVVTTTTTTTTAATLGTNPPTAESTASTAAPTDGPTDDVTDGPTEDVTDAPTPDVPLTTTTPAVFPETTTTTVRLTAGPPPANLVASAVFGGDYNAISTKIPGFVNAFYAAANAATPAVVLMFSTVAVSSGSIVISPTCVNAETWTAVTELFLNRFCFTFENVTYCTPPSQESNAKEAGDAVTTVSATAGIIVGAVVLAVLVLLMLLFLARRGGRRRDDQETASPAAGSADTITYNAIHPLPGFNYQEVKCEPYLSPSTQEYAECDDVVYNQAFNPAYYSHANAGYEDAEYELAEGAPALPPGYIRILGEDEDEDNIYDLASDMPEDSAPYDVAANMADPTYESAARSKASSQAAVYDRADADAEAIYDQADADSVPADALYETAAGVRPGQQRKAGQIIYDRADDHMDDATYAMASKQLPVGHDYATASRLRQPAAYATAAKTPAATYAYADAERADGATYDYASGKATARRGSQQQQAAATYDYADAGEATYDYASGKATVRRGSQEEATYDYASGKATARRSGSDTYDRADAGEATYDYASGKATARRQPASLYESTSAYANASPNLVPGQPAYDSARRSARAPAPLYDAADASSFAATPIYDAASPTRTAMPGQPVYDAASPTTRAAASPEPVLYDVADDNAQPIYDNRQ